MFRMWGKIFHENHMLKDTVICIDSDLNRTRKVYQALEEICYEFDLSKPLWLDHNKNDFIHHSKTRFNSDSFVEDIDFDFLEIIPLVLCGGCKRVDASCNLYFCAVID